MEGTTHVKDTRVDGHRLAWGRSRVLSFRVRCLKGDRQPQLFCAELAVAQVSQAAHDDRHALPGAKLVDGTEEVQIIIDLPGPRTKGGGGGRVVT